MTDKLITCNYQGRLGNLMFEIAATLAAAWDNGLTPSFPWQHDPYYDSIPAFNEYILPLLTGMHRHDAAMPFTEYHEPASYEFAPIVATENTKLVGFFATSLYFDKYRQRIIDFFTWQFKKQVDDLYFSQIVKGWGDPVQFISVHVRRQDYVSDYNAALPLEYYKQAVSHFKEHPVFVIFSDDKDWCMDHFDFMDEKIFASSKDYLELLLMGKMDAHILANSTYSGMAAILGDPGKNKTIIAPKNWWPTHHNRNIYEAHWIQI